MVTTDDSERICFLMHLEEGMETEYERRHRELWPEMLAALEHAGYTNYTLFRNGDVVVGYAECRPDAATVTARMAADPVTDRWNESFMGIIQSANPTGNYVVALAEIWHIN